MPHCDDGHGLPPGVRGDWRVMSPFVGHIMRATVATIRVDAESSLPAE